MLLQRAILLVAGLAQELQKCITLEGASSDKEARKEIKRR
jgi:hypothetical protein